MELEPRISLLESKLIDAMAEAKAAKFLAERALDLLSSQRHAAPKNPAPEPWEGAQSESTPSPAPFIKVETVETKPTLAPWYGREAFTIKKEQPLDPSVDDVAQGIWDDVMENDDV